MSYSRIGQTQPLTFTSSPPTSAVLNQSYTYKPSFNIPTTPSLQFLQGTTTNGMTMQNDGTLNWTPTSPGNFTVNLEATSNDGSKQTQSWSIAVPGNSARPIAPGNSTRPMSQDTSSNTNEEPWATPQPIVKQKSLINTTTIIIAIVVVIILVSIPLLLKE